MSEEGEFTKEKEEIPPVLPVSSSNSGGAAKGGAEPSPIVTTVGDAGASLTEKLDSWQASGLPEEKTYFSCDVSNKKKKKNIYIYIYIFKPIHDTQVLRASMHVHVI